MQAEDAARAEATQQSIIQLTDAMRDMQGNPSLVGALDALSAQMDSLHNSLAQLLRGTHTIPTLMIVLPEIKDQSMTGYLRRGVTRVFTQKYTLFFLCSHTRGIAPCGPNGKGDEDYNIYMCMLVGAGYIYIHIYVITYVFV